MPLINPVSNQSSLGNQSTSQVNSSQTIFSSRRKLTQVPPQRFFADKLLTKFVRILSPKRRPGFVPPYAPAKTLIHPGKPQYQSLPIWKCDTLQSPAIPLKMQQGYKATDSEITVGDMIKDKDKNRGQSLPLKPTTSGTQEKVLPSNNLDALKEGWKEIKAKNKVNTNLLGSICELSRSAWHTR